MRADRPLLRLLRGLLAAVLLLGLWQSAPAVSQTAVPAWMADAICHAPNGDDGGSAPHADLHEHCAWCQGAVPLALLPEPAVLPIPREAQAGALTVAQAALRLSRDVAFYSSRAPPTSA